MTKHFPSIADFLRAADPGFVRLLIALRGTATVFLTYFVATQIFSTNIPSNALAMIGATIAMIGGLAVNDPTLRRQKVTMLLLPLPAAATMTAGILLRPWPQLNLGVFLACTFAMVAMRRFGPRGAALGTMGFMAYFFSLFFQFDLAAIPWVIAAILLGLFLGYAIRFWVLPDHPRTRFRRVAAAYEAAMRELLGEIALSLETEGQRSARLERAQWRVMDISLLLEDSLQGGLFSPEAKARLESWLFETEFTARRLARWAQLLRSRGDVTAEQRNMLAAWVREARARLGRPEGATNETRAPDPLLLGFLTELRRLLKLAPIPEIPGDVLRAEHTEIPSPRRLPLLEQTGQRFHPHTRLGIQVALATGLASVAGAILSPERWYWAAFTAYVVFAGATSGDTVVRAAYRVLGTATGLVSGLVLVHLIQGHPNVETALALLCVFLGLYFSLVSFAWSTFWFTALLALFYHLLGITSPGILLLRLEETLVGAVIGGLIATLVMPVSTRLALRQALVRLLSQVGDAFLASAAGSTETRATARALGREWLNLRLTAAPYLGPMGFLTGPAKGSAAKELVLDVSALVYYSQRAIQEYASLPQADRADCRLLGETARDQADLLREAPPLRLRSRPSSSPISIPRPPSPKDFAEAVRQLLASIQSRWDLPKSSRPMVPK